MGNYINKVVYGNEVLIDLTADTVDASKLLKGTTAHNAAGETITGTCEYDANTQDATAKVGEVLDTKTFYAQGVKKTGTMPNIGKQTSNITNLTAVSIAQGYHDGSGTVAIDDTEKAKIKAENIKDGVSILGVTGTLKPSSDVKAQAKSFTPTKTGGSVLPDSGFDYLSQVTVAAIPYVETENSAGGKTATIAGV